MVIRAVLLLSALATTSLNAAARKSAGPPDGSNWQRVEALPTGTSVELKFKARHHLLCSVKAVTGDTFTCIHDIGFGSKDEAFTRTEIKTIKLARRARSGVYGALIGAGAGATAGGILAKENTYFSGFRTAFAIIYAFVGGIAGAPTGYLTDFTASTIYRAD